MTGAVEDGQLTLPQLVGLGVLRVQLGDAHQVGVQVNDGLLHLRGGQGGREKEKESNNERTYGNYLEDSRQKKEEEWLEILHGFFYSTVEAIPVLSS